MTFGIIFDFSNHCFLRVNNDDFDLVENDNAEDDDAEISHVEEMSHNHRPPFRKD